MGPFAGRPWGGGPTGLGRPSGNALTFGGRPGSSSPSQDSAGVGCIMCRFVTKAMKPFYIILKLSLSAPNTMEILSTTSWDLPSIFRAPLSHALSGDKVLAARLENAICQSVNIVSRSRPIYD